VKGDFGICLFAGLREKCYKHFKNSDKKLRQQKPKWKEGKDPEIEKPTR